MLQNRTHSCASNTLVVHLRRSLGGALLFACTIGAIILGYRYFLCSVTLEGVWEGTPKDLKYFPKGLSHTMIREEDEEISELRYGHSLSAQVAIAPSGPNQKGSFFRMTPYELGRRQRIASTAFRATHCKLPSKV